MTSEGEAPHTQVIGSPPRLATTATPHIQLTEHEKELFDILIGAANRAKQNTVVRVAGGWVRWGVGKGGMGSRRVLSRVCWCVGVCVCVLVCRCSRVMRVSHMTRTRPRVCGCVW